MAAVNLDETLTQCWQCGDLSNREICTACEMDLARMQTAVRLLAVTLYDDPNARVIIRPQTEKTFTGSIIVNKREVAWYEGTDPRDVYEGCIGLMLVESSKRQDEISVAVTVAKNAVGCANEN